MISLSMNKSPDGYSVNVGSGSESFVLRKVFLEVKFPSSKESKQFCVTLGNDDTPFEVKKISSKNSVNEKRSTTKQVNGEISIKESKVPKLGPKEDINSKNDSPKKDKNGENFKDTSELVSPLSDSPKSGGYLNKGPKRKEFPPSEEDVKWEKELAFTQPSETRQKSNHQQHSRVGGSVNETILRENTNLIGESNQRKCFNNSMSSISESFYSGFRRNVMYLEDQLPVMSLVDTLSEGQSIGGTLFVPLRSNRFQYFVRFEVPKIFDMSYSMEQDIIRTSPHKCPRVRLGNLVTVRGADREFYRAQVARIFNSSIRVLQLDTGRIEDVNEWYTLNSKFYQIPWLSALLKPLKEVPKSTMNEIFAKIVQMKQPQKIQAKVVQLLDKRVKINGKIEEYEQFYFNLISPRGYAIEALMYWEQKLKDKLKSERYDAPRNSGHDFNQNIHHREAVQIVRRTSSNDKNLIHKRSSEFEDRKKLFVSQSRFPKEVKEKLQFEKLHDKESILLCQHPSDPSIVFMMGNEEKMIGMYEKGRAWEPFLAKHEDPRVGSIVLAKYQDDEKSSEYTRAMVLEKLPDKMFKIIFLDFGCEDTIKGDNLFALPDVVNVDKIPIQALKCIVMNHKEVKNYTQIVKESIEHNISIEYQIIEYLGEGTYRINFVDKKPK